MAGNKRTGGPVRKRAAKKAAGNARAPRVHELPGESGSYSIGAGARVSRIPADAGHAERDAAFDAEHYWNEKPLYPFSIDRESMFTQQRAAMGAPPIMRAVNDFDAFLADAMRILFICSHTPEELLPLRRDSGQFQAAIDAWAVKNIPRGEGGKAISLGMEIYAQSLATEHEPVPSGHKKDEAGN